MRKKAHFSIVVAGLLMGGAGAAQAQVTLGPRLGANASTLSFDIDGESPDAKYIVGPQAGVTLNAQFGNLSVQPSILFSSKGAKFDESSDETYTLGGDTYRQQVKQEATIRLNYIEVPVNLVFNTSGEEGGFQVFAGPYIGIGLKGSYKTEGSYSVSVNGQVEESFSGSEEEDIKFVGKGTDGDEPEFRRIDVGLNAGVGYKAGPFQAQLGYGLGLGNLVPKYEDDDSDDKLHNRGVQLSVSYFFGVK
ncbi:PorT family protein [Hymenobacter sp. HSC-4F20]|uniref:porin family protein n=1 Tax=Hymenobacter sp. HSC-4F20 TaxID=2864135 RepID=UPI001C733B10|nr:porin family protein [Hymenobacter sp. HSC-4F20]MBX0291025.1 PorT family protein [Hymenobacter sp. HSC-4F20]